MRVAVDGTRLWFDVEGAGLVPDGAAMRERPTVVLLHGGPGGFDHSYLKPDFARLAEVAQVVYLDLPGHGRSEHGDPAAWTFEGAADAVRGFCETIGLERPIVYGHSLGSFVAMVYGIRHPGHPRALVLQSAMARVDVSRIVESFRAAGGDEVGAIAMRAYGRVGEPVTDEEWDRCRRLFGPWVPGDEERARTVTNPELNADGRLLQSFDAVADLGRIACPTLVCAGDLDPITPASEARLIADRVPDARLAVVEGAGHFTWRDAPDRYWPLLAEFVTAV